MDDVYGQVVTVGSGERHFLSNRIFVTDRGTAVCLENTHLTRGLKVISDLVINGPILLVTFK